MCIRYKLTKKISDFLVEAELEEISIGCSDSQVIRINKNKEIYFLKISKKGMLKSEYEKLNWLKGKLKVPEIILYDYSDDNEYLITESIEGNMVCSEKFVSNPNLGLKIIAEAFKNIENVNIENCPINVDIDYKLTLIENNVKNGLIKITDVKEETLKKYNTLENIVEYLKNHKFYSDPCFSHGDTSLPNIFANKDKFSGFIDVGECGVADKWFDLAICEKSIKRNYGKKFISEFYKELNIIPDREKIDYYLLMMELYL